MLDSTKIYNELKKELAVLDQERIRFYSKVKPFKYTFLIFFLGMGAYLIFTNMFTNEETAPSVYIGYGIGSFILLLTYLIIHSINLKKFKLLFTEQIAPKIINGLGETFTYEYDATIPVDEIRQSLLFAPFDSYDGQDLVKGEINNTNISFCEIDMTKTTRINNEDKKVPVFSGIYFRADIELNFPANIWLVKGYNPNMGKNGKQQIKIEHPGLKPYKVYTDNEDMARSILQPFILDRIKSLNDKIKEDKISGRPVSFHFGGQTVQISIDTTKKFMEPKLSKTINSEEFIKEQTSLLNSLYNLLNDLTLK